jgi:hypothetical protein
VYRGIKAGDFIPSSSYLLFCVDSTCICTSVSGSTRCVCLEVGVRRSEVVHGVLPSQLTRDLHIPGWNGTQRPRGLLSEHPAVTEHGIGGGTRPTGQSHAIRANYTASRNISCSAAAALPDRALATAIGPHSATPSLQAWCCAALRCFRARARGHARESAGYTHQPALV